MNDGAESAATDELNIMLIEANADERSQGMEQLLRQGHAPSSWSYKEAKYLPIKSRQHCIDPDLLYHTGHGGMMQRAIPSEDRLRVLHAMHDDARHHGAQFTLQCLLDR